MDIPELPRRLYTSGEEPEAHNSISYHTDNSKLHTALRKALTDDEFEELKESSLGVFIKFKEQGFGWASRLVHYMLSFKLDIKKKYEMWSLVGPEPLRFSLLEFENLTGLNCEYIEDLETPKCDVTPEMVSFWGMLGVHLEAGPTTDQIIAALQRCGDWSREDRKRLAYLSIFTGFIEGRKFSTATRSTLARLVMDLERFENYPWGRVAFKVLMDSLWNKEIAGCYTVDGFIQVLQVWTYTAMPELGASIGGPRADSPSPPILAYEGSRGRRSMKAAILSQTRVINFVEKDISEMWPKWDSEVEDLPAENIIKVMYERRPWKWTMDCWEVTGTKVNTKPKVVTPSKKAKEMVVLEEEEEEEEDNPRPRKKARKEAPKVASEEAREEAGGATPQDKQPTPLAKETGGRNKQATPQDKQPTPLAKETGGRNKQATPHANETVVSNQPPPHQTKQQPPPPQKKQQQPPPPQKKQPPPQKKQPPQIKERWLPEDTATEANSVNKTSKEIVAVTSTDHQPSLASTDQQPSLASTEPSDPVSEPSLVVLDKRAKSKRAKKPAPTVRSPYTAEKKKDKVAAYNPFPPVNKDRLKELADWLKTDPHYLTKTEDKPRTSPTRWYHFLRTARGWLEDCHIDAWINVLRQRYQENPQAFRSERMCFLDHNFSQSWREQYHLFKTSEPDHKGLGRVLPGGASYFYDGSIPSFCQSNKKWGEDIDDIYAPVNLDDKHWVAIWISIPKRHIVVWDSIPSSSVPDAWDAIMEPFLQMVPYLLVECAATDEIRVKYGLEPYTYERPLKGVPTANNGDCGVYTVKYIECHALGVSFDPKDFARCNAKKMRDNMAVDIWKELVDQHLKENVDGDKFVGLYD
ncbi:uncharacterized protein LOC111207285 [Brassica napus]|uniref:uncharacterized protein LOC111207285 n=1 Tax=Brassica napus TaxID=3708 RepID=UPI00207964A8|nr:uncharacterized protein LOC111207285 [Brassica napus]